MKTVWGSILLAALLAAPFADAASRAPEPPVTATQAAASTNAFAVDLYGRLSGDDGNLFFSPSSLAIALAMTYAGAREETAAEMATVLHLPDRGDAVHAAWAELQAAWTPGEGAAHRLEVANRLWPQVGFDLQRAYVELIRDRYDGGLQPLDFAHDTEGARRTINAWVEERTEEKIKDLLPVGSLEPFTRLVLTNAVYFLGDWEHAFASRSTHDASFRLPDGESVQVPMMRQVERFKLGVHDGLRVLELPYAGDELSMYVLLPDAPDGLPDLERRLDAATLEAWLAEAPVERVRCLLPKWRVTASFDLGKVLAAMGMSAAFDGACADFSGMTGHKDLVIDRVIHKAYVDVDEEGTEAAAATAVTMKLTSVSHEPPPVEFICDHPFLYLIRHRETGAILFLGRLADPRAS